MASDAKAVEAAARVLRQMYHVRDEIEVAQKVVDAIRAALPDGDAVCSGCGASRLDAINVVIAGKTACCPDCSTLTVEERNELRAATPPAPAWTVERFVELIRSVPGAVVTLSGRDNVWRVSESTAQRIAEVLVAARIALSAPAQAECGTCKGTGRKRTLLEVGNGAETWQDEPCPRCTNPATGGV